MWAGWERLKSHDHDGVISMILTHNLTVSVSRFLNEIMKLNYFCFSIFQILYLLTLKFAANFNVAVNYFELGSKLQILHLIKLPSSFGNSEISWYKWLNLSRISLSFGTFVSRHVRVYTHRIIAFHTPIHQAHHPYLMVDYVVYLWRPYCSW